MARWRQPPIHRYIISSPADLVPPAALLQKPHSRVVRAAQNRHNPLHCLVGNTHTFPHPGHNSGDEDYGNVADSPTPSMTQVRAWRGRLCLHEMKATMCPCVKTLPCVVSIPENQVVRRFGQSVSQRSGAICCLKLEQSRCLPSVVQGAPQASAG